MIEYGESMANDKLLILICSLCFSALSWLGLVKRYYLIDIKKFTVFWQRLGILLLGLVFTFTIVTIDTVMEIEVAIDVCLFVAQVILSMMYLVFIEIMCRKITRFKTLVRLMRDFGINERTTMSEIVVKIETWAPNEYTTKEIRKAYEQLKKKLQTKQEFKQ